MSNFSSNVLFWRWLFCSQLVVRALVPRMNLDELFEQKGEVAKAVLEELEKVVLDFLLVIFPCTKFSRNYAEVHILQTVICKFVFFYSVLVICNDGSRYRLVIQRNPYILHFLGSFNLVGFGCFIICWCWLCRWVF